jgi:hypothetical protein
LNDRTVHAVDVREVAAPDFLVPVSTVIARQARFRMLVRLWVGTLVANLVGGCVFTWFLMRGYPDLNRTAIEAGRHYVNLGLGLRAFSLAVLGGVVITLMTWMQHGTKSDAARVIAAVTGAFLLAGGQTQPRDREFAADVLRFAHGSRTLRVRPMGADCRLGHRRQHRRWCRTVTSLRVLQVPHKVQAERDSPAPGVAIGDDRRVGPTEET